MNYELLGMGWRIRKWGQKLHQLLLL